MPEHKKKHASLFLQNGKMKKSPCVFSNGKIKMMKSFIQKTCGPITSECHFLRDCWCIVSHICKGVVDKKITHAWNPGRATRWAMITF
jgi:hypothetical protein